MAFFVAAGLKGRSFPDCTFPFCESFLVQLAVASAR